MKKTGFTLVELLVVMVVLLLLVGIGLKSYTGAKARAKNTQVKAGIHEVQVALESFAVDHNNFFPGLNWGTDSGGNLTVAPGVLGGVETDGARSPSDGSDFQNWRATPPEGGPVTLPPGYNPDFSPKVEYLDTLITNGYLESYPANPFLSVGSGRTSQMTNLFWYVPDLQTGLFDVTDEASVDWNRLTNRQAGQTTKTEYESRARGHFTYIPFAPVNNQGWDFINDWPNLNDDARSQFYKYCRGYVLIGWGASREDTTESKGFSQKYFRVDTTDPNNPVEGYDLDDNLRIDFFERNLINLTLPEQANSQGTTPANFGGMVGGNAFRDIDDALAGATIVLTP